MARSPTEKPPPASAAPRGRPAADPGDVEVVGDASTLWARALGGDEKAIEELAQQHQQVAVSTAAAYYGRGIDRGELVEEAHHALRRAIFAYRPERSGNFVAFAKKVVRNHLADLFRQRSTRTRHERDQSVAYAAARTQLGNELGRLPNPDEIYERLDWSETKRINHASAEQRRHMTSIQADNEDGSPPVDVEARSRSSATLCRAGRLAAILPELDNSSRRVIKERFFGEDRPSQEETARRLGMTVYRVQQIEKRAFSKLASLLESAETADEIDGPAQH